MQENSKIGVGFGVMLLRGNEILLGLRHTDPTKADSELHGEGTWTMPGGKLHFGESFEVGAQREMLEETSIHIETNDLEVISLSNDMVPDAHFVTVGMLCRMFQGEAKVVEPNEITEWKWFDLNKLPKNIFFPSARVLANYTDKRFYTPE